MVDVAVGVTATFLFCINSGWMRTGRVGCFCFVRRGCVTKCSANMVLGMLACCWVSGAAHGLHALVGVCGCGCLVGLHVNDHCAVCGVWLLWCGCVV